MKVLGQIQTNQDITNKEYIDLYGGKIDVIKVDGIVQPIDRKVVNIDLSGKANADQLPLKVDKYSQAQLLRSSDVLTEGIIENKSGQPYISSCVDGNGFELRVTTEGLQQIEYQKLQDSDGTDIQNTRASLLVTEDSLSNTSNELRNYINNIEIISVDPEDANYTAAYALVNADGTKLGSVINIPKNFLVKDAVLRVCEEDNVPEAGLKVGDRYIDFIINTAESELKHVYLNVQDLVSAYVAGRMISIENNEISVKAEEGNGLTVINNSLAMNLVSEYTSGTLTSDDYLKLLSIETNAQVNKIESVDSNDFIIDNKVLKVVDGKSLLTSTQAAKLDAVIDNATRIEQSNINGAIKINDTDLTVYTHPTVIPEEVGAYKVGKDGNGHVVLGNALALSDLITDEQHRVVTDTEKATWDAKTVVEIIDWNN